MMSSLYQRIAGNLYYWEGNFAFLNIVNCGQFGFFLIEYCSYFQNYCNKLYVVICVTPALILIKCWPFYFQTPNNNSPYSDLILV